MTKTPKMAKFTKKDFDAMFPDNVACLDWLKNYLYPDGIHCPKCNRITAHHRVNSRPSYSCDYCGHHVHPTAGTIFHKSPTPLTTWFYAIYLMASTRCGISAKQIERETGVTYKTAWRMFKQIRSMLVEDHDPFGGPGGKPLEMDETYVGGKPRAGRRGGSGRPGAESHKTPVFGIVERKGKVIAYTAPNVKVATINGILRERVLPKSTVFTDEFAIYDGLSKEHNHSRIRHAEKIYVVGDTHTNTIEGFWSLIKRGIGGVYHNVSREYLQMYLNEYSFRYNHRKDSTPMFVTFLNQISKTDGDLREAQAVGNPY